MQGISLSILCKVVTITYLKQTMFLGYIKSQLFRNMPRNVATELKECDSQHAPEYCMKKRSQGFGQF